MATDTTPASSSIFSFSIACRCRLSFCPLSTPTTLAASSTLYLSVVRPSQRRKWQTADIDTAVIEQLSISFLICRAFENLWIFPILLTFVFFFFIRNSPPSPSLYHLSFIGFRPFLDRRRILIELP